MARDYCSHRPTAYALGKQREMTQRWNNAIGESVRAFAPQIFPGQPEQMGVAYSSNVSGAAPWTDAISAAGFWEIGIYNTPAGTDIGSPPPNGQAWVRIANSEEARSILGRRPTTSTSDWKSMQSIPDQVVIGLIDYRDDRANVASRIPAVLAPADPGSQWFAMLSSMGYTSSTGAVTLINRHAEALAAFDEASRFGALLRLAAADAREGNVTSQQAYPLVRAWERLETGRMLAASTGGRVQWFEVGLGDTFAAVEHELTKAWLGGPSGCVPNPGYDAAIAPPDPNAPVGEEESGVAQVLVPAGAVVLIGAAAIFAGWSVRRYMLARAARNSVPSGKPRTVRR